MMTNVPFEDRRRLALEEAEKREAEVYAANPEIQAIDRELSNTGLNLFKAGLLPEKRRAAEFERLERLTFSLQAKRRELLVKLGYPEDYTKPRFECEKCADTGYIGHKMCECYKKYLVRERAHASGLGRYLDSQNFDTFSLEYYPEKTRKAMKDNLDSCRDYAERFDGKSGESLLFVGSTGLGKTHLSSAIAQKVIEKGFSVVYDSAQNVLATFERDRFSQSITKPSDKYFNCDLLIIDDLGTELRGTSAASYFYTLINSRLVASRSVIISTNLSPTALRQQYEERFVSRLFGEYNVFIFEGEDIRKIKKVRSL